MWCGVKTNGELLRLSAILHGTSKAIPFRERHLHALKVRVIGELSEAKEVGNNIVCERERGEKVG